MVRPDVIRRPFILALFFISGACGLLYELVWIRMAGTVIGNTTYAVGTVVAVYMGGLALGARLGGRTADRRQGATLLGLYGLLEGGVAISACLVPLLFVASEPLFRVLWNSVGETAWLYATLRVLLVAVILIVPTTLMGATLPVLSRFLSATAERAAREAGRAYAINTLGGVAGTLAAGFWMIPSFGLRATLFAAATLNAAIALAAILFARGGGGEAKAELSVEPPPRKLALVVSAVSGLASLAYEVAWSRSLVLSLGSSVQALTLILSAFILGLALGSALASRFAHRAKDPTLALAILQAAVGVAALILLPFLGDLPLQIAGYVSSFGKSYGSLLAIEFGLIALMILVPSMILGAVFPYACRLAAGSDQSVGRTVGAVYTWNTAGSIAGTLSASFFLVPTIGLSRTICLAASINLVLAAFLLATSPERRRIAAIAPVAAAVIGWVRPEWSSGVVASGSFLYGPTYVEGARAMKVSLEDFLEHLAPTVAEYWDAYGLTSVHRQGSDRESVLFLRVNGKADASTDEHDMVTQLYLAHVPLVHHPAPKRVLVIGLGAGFTLGAVTDHPVEKIDCVEISSAMIRAAEHFAEKAHWPRRDPRVRLIEGDGRNFVQFTRDSYDVIISEPSNLWVSGMANLFTQEFFSEVRARLAPGGMFCQWMCAARLDAEDFRMVLRTFFKVFPEGSVWELAPGGDYLFLGCEHAVPLRLEDLEKRLSRPLVKKDVEEEAMPEALGFAGYLLADAEGARWIAGDGPTVTDDHLTLEFTAPRSLLRDTRGATITFLEPARLRPVERTHFANLSEDWARRIARRREDRRLFAHAVVCSEQEHYDASLDLLETIGAEVGRDGQTTRFRENVVQILLGQATQLLSTGDPAGAIRKLGLVPRSSRQWGAVQVKLALAYQQEGRADLARERYREAAADRAAAFDAFVGLAQLSQAEGDAAKATGFWREAIQRRPNDAPVRLGLVGSLIQEGRRDQAREACLEVLRVDPQNANARKILEALDRR